MKIILTESQYNFLKEGLSDDSVFRNTIKGYESTVTDSSGKHYVFDDRDSNNPKTFVNSPNKKKGGTLTIGWGHTGQDAKIGNKISNSRAEDLLTQDINSEESKTKTLFPKYNSYPLYVQRALVNSVYRGEAKSSYEWVKEINTGNWTSASKKYLEGWNIDFSKAKNPRYRGGVADRMVKNQEAFLKYASELKSKPKPPSSSNIVYPKKTSDTDYVNVRTSPEVNNGYFTNIITTVKYPNKVGKYIKSQNDETGKTWYYVELEDNLSWWYDYGWVRSDAVTK